MKLEFEIDDSLIPEGYTARIGVPKEKDSYIISDGSIHEAKYDWRRDIAVILDKKPVLKEIRFTPTGPEGVCQNTWAYTKLTDAAMWVGSCGIVGIPLKMEVIWE